MIDQGFHILTPWYVRSSHGIQYRSALVLQSSIWGWEQCIFTDKFIEPEAGTTDKHNLLTSGSEMQPITAMALASHGASPYTDTTLPHRCAKFWNEMGNRPHIIQEVVFTVQITFKRKAFYDHSRVMNLHSDSIKMKAFMFIFTVPCSTLDCQEPLHIPPNYDTCFN